MNRDRNTSHGAGRHPEPAPIFRPYTTTLDLWTRHRCFPCLGLAPETLQHFEANYYGADRGFLAHRLLVRLHDARGLPLGYTGCHGSPVSCARSGSWIRPRGFPHQTLFYNWHRASIKHHQPLIMTTGPWTVMKLYQAGFRNAVALFTPHLNFHNSRLIAEAPPPTIVLLFPGDDHNAAAARRIATILGSRARNVFMSQDLTPDDFTDQDLREILSPYCHPFHP